jgi:hypothetical protein
MDNENRNVELDVCGWYSDWHGLDEKRSRSLSHIQIENFLLYTVSRPTPGNTQSSIKWVVPEVGGGRRRRGKAVREREICYLPPTSADV